MNKEKGMYIMNHDNYLKRIICLSLTLLLTFSAAVPVKLLAEEETPLQSEEVLIEEETINSEEENPSVEETTAYNCYMDEDGNIIIESEDAELLNTISQDRELLKEYCQKIELPENYEELELFYDEENSLLILKPKETVTVEEPVMTSEERLPYPADIQAFQNEEKDFVIISENIDWLNKICTEGWLNFSTDRGYINISTSGLKPEETKLTVPYGRLTDSGLVSRTYQLDIVSPGYNNYIAAIDITIEDEPINIQIDQDENYLLFKINGFGSDDYKQELLKGVIDENNVFTHYSEIKVTAELNSRERYGLIRNYYSKIADNIFEENYLENYEEGLRISKDILRQRGFYDGDYVFEFDVEGYNNKKTESFYLELGTQLIPNVAYDLRFEYYGTPKTGDSTEISPDDWAVTTLIDNEYIPINNQIRICWGEKLDLGEGVVVYYKTGDKMLQPGKEYYLMITYGFVGDKTDPDIKVSYNQKEYEYLPYSGLPEHFYATELETSFYLAYAFDIDILQPETNTIAYATNGGTLEGNYPLEFKTGVNVKLPVPVKTGYTFEGWCLKEDLSDKAFTSITPKTNDSITLYARWKENSYKLAYNFNGGKGSTIATKTYKTTSQVTVTDNIPSRTGYEFAGWTAVKNNDSLIYSAGEVITGINANLKDGSTVTLYALWKPVSVNSISVTDSKGNANLTVFGKKTLQLKATVNANALNKKVSWAIAPEDTDKAKISSSGLLTSRLNEKDTITVIVSSQDKAITQPVTVNVIPLTSTINIYDENTEYLKGQTIGFDAGTILSLNLNARCEPGGSLQDVKWTSSNSSVAKVENGTVTLTGKKGSAKITVTSTDGSKASSYITINVNALVHKIEIQGADEIGQGKSVTLKALATRNDNISPASKSVSWSSEDETIAKVSSSGKVTALSQGTTTITATARDGSGVTQAHEITVKPAVTAVNIFNDDTKANNSTIYLDSCSINDENRRSLLNLSINNGDSSNKVLWTTSSSSIARLIDTESGIFEFTGKAGIVKLTAKAQDGSGRSAYVNVKVSALASSISIKENSHALAVSKSLTLTADLKTVNNTVPGVKTVKWTSSDTTVATVSNGKVTGKKPGTVYITASTADGTNLLSEPYKIEIKPLTSKVELSYNGNELISNQLLGVELSSGSLKLDAKATAANGTPSQDITWAISYSGKANANAATIDATTGEIKLLKNGQVTVTAVAKDSSNKKTSIKLNITDKLTDTIKVEKTALIVEQNKNLQLSPVALDSKGEIISNVKFIYKSSDTKIATVDSRGKVTGKKAGQAAEITISTSDGSLATQSVRVRVYSKNDSSDLEYITKLAELENNIDDAQKQLTEAQNSLDSLNNELNSLNSEINEITDDKTLEEYIEKLNSDITAAEEELNKAKENFETRKAEYEQLRNSKLKEAENQYNASSKEIKDSYDASTADAKKAYEEATKTQSEQLDAAKAQAETDYSSAIETAKQNPDYLNAISNDEKARQKLADLEKQIKETETKIASAKTQLQTAKDNLKGYIENTEYERNEANNKLSKFKEAEEKYNEALRKYEEKTAEIQNLEKSINEVINAKNDAYQAVFIAQGQLDAANNDLSNPEYLLTISKAEFEQAEYIYLPLEKQYYSGALGFYQSQYTLNEYNEKVYSSDVQRAIDMMNYYSSDAVPEEIRTMLGEKGDATSLENVKRAIELMKEGNELRTSDDNYDSEALLVTNKLMANAQVSANAENEFVNHWALEYDYSEYLPGNVNSSWGYNGENAAWGWNDPYSGWYHEEKEYYDFIQEYRDNNPTATKEEWVAAAKAAGKYPWSSGGSVGHYTGLTQPSYVYTGLAVNNETNSPTGGVNHVQQFNRSGNIGLKSDSVAYTVDEYYEMFNNYCDDISNRFNEAKTVYEAAKADYEQRLANGGISNADLENIAQLEKNLKEAQDNYDLLDENYNNLCNQLNELNNEKNELENEKEMALAEYNSAYNSGIQAEETLERLDSKQAEYQAVVDEKQTVLDNLVISLADLNTSKEQAQKDADKAAEVLSSETAKYQDALLEAQNAKEKAISDAEDSYEANTADALKAYEEATAAQRKAYDEAVLKNSEDYNATTEKINEEYDKLIEEAGTEVNNIEKLLTELQKNYDEIGSLKEKLETLKKKLNKAQEDVNTAETAYNEAVKAKDEFIAQN